MTETQALEDRLLKSLETIRLDWPHLLPTKPGGQRMGRRGKAALIKHPDNDPRGDDLDALTRRLDTAHHVTHVINSWVRLIASDAHVTQTLPNGFDVEDMCVFLERWSRWASGHEAAQDMAAELDAASAAIREFVPPAMEPSEYLRTKPAERMTIGRCTEEIEHEDGSLKACAGRVQAYPQGDGVPDEHNPDDPWATCERCGSRAVVSVWLQWMFPEVAAETAGLRDRVLTVDEVISLAKREFGRPVSRQAVWQWVSRGLLEPVDRSTKPHVFRLGDVVDVLAAKAG